MYAMLPPGGMRAIVRTALRICRADWRRPGCVVGRRGGECVVWRRLAWSTVSEKGLKIQGERQSDTASM